MKIKKILTLIILLFAISLSAQEMNMEEAMKMAAPGPEHKLLTDMAGKFKQKIKFYFAPGQSMDGEGSGITESIIGGRFIQVKSVGKIMGMDTEVLMILGYDKRKNKYTLFSIDGMGTYSISAEGDYDASTKIMTLKGTEEDPAMKMKMDFKFVFDLSDLNERKMNIIFIKPDGSENKMVEVTSTKIE
ncbi:MAG: DUF1579 family protein [Bacteroidetes bacterium]|nr:DUF1579 family protein [Bacteroidota bacterium]